MASSRVRRFLGASVGLGTATALVLTGCGGNSTAPAEEMQTVSQAEIDEALSASAQLTFWAWLPDAQVAVDAFEAKYPNIDIKLEQTSSADHEQRLRNAIEAGTAVPDVFQLPAGSVSSFVLTEDLLDLKQYGGASLEEKFTPVAWRDVSVADGVYGVPQDSGPVASLYRTDIFEEAGVEFPSTWEEFAEAAPIVKEKTGSYIGNLSFLEIQTLPTQLSQQPLTDWDGAEGVTIAVDNPQVIEWANYWQDLIDRDLVSTDAVLTDPWYQGMAAGKYASWTAGAFAPIFLQGTAGDTAGKWTAAPIPQWESASEVANVNGGGSVTSVSATTENPIVAAEFAKWLGSDPVATGILTNELGLFPATLAQMEETEWRNQEDPFFAGQETNEVFAEASKNASADVALPFSGYYRSSLQDTVVKALAEGTPLADGFHAWQDALVEYAKQQGFTVKEG